MGPDRRAALRLVATMVMIMWAVEIIDIAVPADLDRLGIEPREADGLIGVALAPFLHAGIAHLLGNSVPFLLLGGIIALSGLRRVAAVTVIVALVAGLATWMIGPDGTTHVGASGIVFGYATYLISRGLFDHRILYLVGGGAVIALFGGMLLGGIVPTPGISWQSHLFGAVGGVLAARALSGPGRAAEPQHHPQR